MARISRRRMRPSRRRVWVYVPSEAAVEDDGDLLGRCASISTSAGLSMVSGMN